MKLTTRAFLVATALSLVPLAAAGTAMAATAVPPGWIAENMEPVGYIDLEDRLAIKLAITQKNGRWYLFTAYNQEEGPSPRPGALVVIDITDPQHPRRIKEIEGPPDTEMAQVSLHGNLLITSMARRMTPQLATGSAQPHPPTTAADEGIQLWDISDPANPRPVGQWETGAYGTHRNSYPGGRYAYAAAFRPGFKGRVMVILDVSDPSHPWEVTEWHQYGQKDGETLAEGQARSGGFHGPAQISPDGKMLTTAYAPDLINLDITDIAHPKVIGRLTLTPPFADVGSQSEHTALPYWDRKLVYVSGEASRPNCGGGREGLPLQAMIDNHDPAHPTLLSVFPSPRPPAALGLANFCDRPGRFGPHNISTEIHNPDVARPNDLIHVAYFNAGMWVYDIHDARLPTIAGYFIPADSPRPERSQTGMNSVYIAQDTVTDTRGYIYMVGSGGLYVLRDSGALSGRTLGDAKPVQPLSGSTSPAGAP